MWSSASARSSLVQRPALAQRRNWREAVSGLPKRAGSARQGASDQPGAEVSAASQKIASSLPRGSRAGRPGPAARCTKGERTAHSSSVSGAQARWGE